jgi:hypothetical protein
MWEILTKWEVGGSGTVGKGMAEMVRMAGANKKTGARNSAGYYYT